MITHRSDSAVPVLELDQEQPVVCNQDEIDFSISERPINQFESRIPLPGTAEGRLIKDCPHTFECFFFRFVDAIATDEVDLHNLPRLSAQLSIVGMLIVAESSQSQHENEIGKEFAAAVNSTAITLVDET